MMTMNPDFCEEVDDWMENLIKKSVLISGVSEKMRYQFFNKIFNKLNALKRGIEENVI